MRRSVTVLTILLLATAAAAGAGDDIKWNKSEIITYYSPATDPSELGDDPSAIKDNYLLLWSPYFNNDIDDILVRWLSWEWIVTGLNRDLKKGALTRNAYDKKIIEQRTLIYKYILFEIWIEAKTEKFYKSVTEDFWEFILVTDVGDFQPVSEIREGSREATGVTVDVGGEQREIYDPGNLLMHKFEVRFDNPYAEASPIALKLQIRSERYSRGFEWRFVEE